MDDAPMHLHMQVHTQGHAIADAKVDVKATWLLHHLGNRFQCMVYVDDVAQVDASTLSAVKALQRSSISITPLVITRQAGHIEGVTVLTDAQGLFAKRYDAKAGSTWLVRPDQHVSARWRQFDAQKVQAALQQATMAV
jgi:3-(3-hydroxy-phenyl)propionate hydroxylase